MSKYVYLCDCGIGKTKPANKMHPTQVNKDGICVHCEHYAVLKPAGPKKAYNTVTDPEVDPTLPEYEAYIDVETLENPDT